MTPIQTVTRCQPLLGTYVEIMLKGRQSEERLHHHATKAFEVIRCIQRMMSFHDQDSDVSRLNRCGHVAPLRVHPWTHHVISEAVKLSRETNGAFDVTVAARLIRSGLLPRHAAVHSLSEAGLWDEIQLIEDSKIAFRQPLQIDLGGIAKGFAVDKAIDFLSTFGLDGAVVNAGGDLRVLGSAIEKGVGIRDPRDPYRAIVPSVMLRPALATSAAYFVKQRTGFSRASAIVHPVTGKPMKRNISLSVFSRTCVEADALTKAVLLAPQNLWNKALAARDSVALLLTATGEQVLFPA
jgi:thiamine biosynthesis lipoprotein